jgi:hypothetical protein
LLAAGSAVDHKVVSVETLPVPMVVSDVTPERAALKWNWGQSAPPLARAEPEAGTAMATATPAARNAAPYRETRQAPGARRLVIAIASCRCHRTPA